MLAQLARAVQYEKNSNLKNYNWRLTIEKLFNKFLTYEENCGQYWTRTSDLYDVNVTL